MTPEADPTIDAGPVFDGRAGLLAVGSVVNGLAAFLLLAVGLRTYGPDRFASVSVVWSVWSIAAAVMTFPVQHWTIREVTRGTNRRKLQATATRAALGGVALGAILGAGAWVVGRPLLRTESLASPLTIAAIVALAVPVGVTRGRLVGANRYGAAAAAVGGENVFRLVVGVVVASTIGVDWFTASLFLGSLVILVWPDLLVPASPRRAEPFRDILELSLANSVAQVTLAGGPVLVAALGAPGPVVSAVFATMTLARAPYLVLLAASMRFTAGWSETGARLPRRVTVGAVALLCATVIGAAGWLIGPWFVGLLFGADAALSDAATAAVAAGATLALATLVLASLYTATDETATLVRGWATAAVIGLVPLALPLTPLWRTLSWFLATELLAVVVLGLGPWWSARQVRGGSRR